MTELRAELNQVIEQGKQALLANNIDNAIHAFERAAHIASESSPALNSIIGISFAYIALSYGKKGDSSIALEHINTATEYFPVNPRNPLVYAQLLLGLGIEFQKIELHECSIIILKNALTLAKSRTEEVDIEVISIVARNLAFSYNKIGNNVASAKLYRIAADLEDEPKSAIILYRNSAYLYYQEKMKEYTLDILQTAFDKSGILGDSSCQLEIARFQGIVAYEISTSYIQRGYLEKAIAYLDLCNEKFSFTEDFLWVIRAFYEKAMILERMGKDWQRNKVLEKLIKYKITDENKEYIIKAILLLIIHALEGDHFSKAEFYIQQLSNADLQDNPLLGQKIHEIRDLLDISRKRGQIRSDLHFSRKDLDLPVNELLPDVKTPTQDIYREEAKFARLQVPQLDISSKPPPSHKIKQPTIEVLQELFDTSEETQPLIADQELPLRAQELLPIEEPQTDVAPLSEIRPESEQEKTIALERLFRAHQVSPESSALEYSEPLIFSRDSTEVENAFPEEQVSDHLDSRPQVTSTSTIISQDENIRSEVVSRLQRAGWAVELNFTNLSRRGSEPDVIAMKGLIRKTRKFIFFAENPADAEICSFLLQSNPEKGEKIIFLLSGDPRDANISVMVRLITQIGQLF